MTRRTAAFLVLAFAAVVLNGCTSSVDLKQALQVTDVSTGWFDAGVVDGKNKLVPSITFKLKNTSSAKLSSVSLNLTYTFAGDQEHTDDVYVQRVDFEGQETQPITVRTNRRASVIRARDPAAAWPRSAESARRAGARTGAA